MLQPLEKPDKIPQRPVCQIVNIVFITIGFAFKAYVLIGSMVVTIFNKPYNIFGYINNKKRYH